MQVDNSFLPPHRKYDVTPMNVIGGCPSATTTMAPQNVFFHTNSNAQHGVYDESLHHNKGSAQGATTRHIPHRIGEKLLYTI